jgi:hypothetical protein
MATRKLSAETVATFLPDDAILDATLDPAGTALSRAVPVPRVKERIGPSYCMRGLSSANLGAYTLPNGGSVGSVSVTSASGAASGLVNDAITLSVVDPTPPGGGPCIVYVPLVLPNGIPSDFRIQVVSFPAGAVPVDFSFGYVLGTVGPALGVYNEREVTPGATRVLRVSELDPGSGSPAVWNRTINYADTENMLLEARTLRPFTAVPQIELKLTLTSNGGTTYEYATMYTGFPSSGVINDSGDWTGEDLTSINLMLIFGTAYVGTVDTVFSLSIDF